MIFIDTGAFIGRYVANDQYHQEALAFWLVIEKNRDRCVTTNFILDETLTLLGRRAGYPFAAQKGKLILTSKIFEIIRPVEEEEFEALAYFEKFSDQKVSFTDCVSLVTLHKRKIKRIFSFDHFFDKIGLKRLP